MSNAIKCIVRQGWTTRDADGNLIERRDYVYVTNEDGTPHIYASIAEARADIRGNYGRDTNRAGILQTRSVDDYTGHVHDGYVYIVREDADEFAAATADAKAETIAQAVRDDMPTGPEGYHAELVRKADAAAVRFCAAYTDTTGIVPFFEDAAAVCRVARADVAHEYGVTAADRETVSAMTEELADATRPRPTYQRAELLAYLGEPDDYDVTAIEHDATAYDPATGRTVWAVDAETLAAIAERHQLQFYAPAF